MVISTTVVERAFFSWSEHQHISRLEKVWTGDFPSNTCRNGELVEMPKFNNCTGPNKVRIEWQMPKINNRAVPNETVLSGKFI